MMKKCILFIFSLCALFMIQVNLNAASIEDNMKPLVDQSNFNIMKGCPENKIMSSKFYQNANALFDQMSLKDGGVYWDGLIYSYYYPEYSVGTHVEIYGKDKHATSIYAYVDGSLVYQCDINGTKATVTKSSTMDMNEYFKTEDFVYTFVTQSHVYFLDGSTYNEDAFQEYDSEDFGFECMYAASCKTNSYYEGKDLYFVTDVEAPLTEKQILDSIRVEDPSEGNISSKISLENYDYKLVNGKIDVGTYNIMLIASDSKSNITIQKAFVAVCDVKAPLITGSDKKLQYNEKIENVLGLFKATDNSGHCDLTISEDNYSANYNKLGTYTITAKAVDKGENEAFKTISINVVDEVAPVLVTKEAYATTTQPILTKDDLYQYVSCVDEFDKENTIISIEDTNSYFSNQSKKGDYIFNVTGSDQTGNKSYGTIKLSVTDDDFPLIIADTYTITLNQGEKLTKDDIANILLKSGQIKSLDNLMIQSDYFNNYDKPGDYELIVSTKEGVYKNVISVKPKNNDNKNNNTIDTIDYSIPTKTKEEDNNKYIYIGIAVVGIIIIISGAYIYKRKH